MKNEIKNEHLRIRITAEQLTRLCILIQEEKKTKSQFLRDAIEDKLNQLCRRKIYEEKSSLLQDYYDFIQARRENIK